MKFALRVLLALMRGARRTASSVGNALLLGRSNWWDAVGLGAMRTAGLIDYASGGGVFLTEHGKKTVGTVEPMSGRLDGNVVSHVEFLCGRPTIGPKERQVLETLLSGGISRADLGAKIGYTSPKTPTFVNRLGKLRTMGLIDYRPGGGVELTPFAMLNLK